MSGTDRPVPDPEPELLGATPATAYFWGRVAGDGDLDEECVVVRAGDEQAAEALAAVAGADERTHSVEARRSTHDASIVRYEDAYELRVFGGLAARASAAFGLPTADGPGGYRFDVFAAYRAQLVRGLLEACGTVCFRESTGSVGISFVHDDRQLLTTIQSLLAGAEPSVPTGDLAESSSGGYWFGLDDGADTAAFARWLYEGSESSGLYAADRRRKLRRSVERATGADLGGLGP